MIIGIIATLLIHPVENVQKNQTIAKLKKAYTNICQSVKRSEIDNGPSQYWDIGSDSTTIRQNFYKYFAPYLMISKYCNATTDCGYPSGADLKDLMGNYDWHMIDTPSGTTVMLNDGTTIRIRAKWNGHVFIFIDLNGGKKPNVYGKDVFVFEIDQSGKGVVPTVSTPDGASTTNADCAKVTNGGWLCALKIIQDGWTIAKDYPW